VIAGDNRASLLAAVIASLLLLLTGHWRIPAQQGALIGAGLAAVVALATLSQSEWAQRKLHGLEDRLSSIVDFSGSNKYTSEESSNTGDNNRFRMVWWATVAQETWDRNPAFGLGFGYDLAKAFIQEYSPEATDEFTARSPHSIFVTAFGRMGLAGLATWLLLCGFLAHRMWSALRRSTDPVQWSLWCASGMILITASFGVVLEGPMGAVVFWILVGLANAAYKTGHEEPAA
jgi:O-antigen ligase